MRNIVRFMEGKNKGFVAYNDNGKIILSRNDVQPGYYKVSNIEEKEKVILVDTKRVTYDYFPGIDYDEFLEVLKYNKFKIGFIEDFHYEHGDYKGDDHLVFAYDMTTHIVIVAESWDSGRCLNGVEVYCPGMNGFHLSVSTRVDLGYSSGNNEMSKFELVRSKDIFNKNTGEIHILKGKMKPIVESNENIYTDSISLYHYAERGNTPEFFSEARKKIKLANRKDMIELFGQSKTMMDALNS